MNTVLTLAGTTNDLSFGQLLRFIVSSSLHTLISTSSNIAWLDYDNVLILVLERLSFLSTELLDKGTSLNEESDTSSSSRLGSCYAIFNG